MIYVIIYISVHLEVEHSIMKINFIIILHRFNLMCTICKNSITLVYLRQIIYIGSYFNRMQDTRCLNKIDQPLIQNQQTQNNPAYKLQI